MIRVTLPYPISANRYWASRVITVKGRHMPVTYVTSEAKDFKEQVLWICRAAGIRAPLQGAVEISVDLFPGRPLDWEKRMRKLGPTWHHDVRCIDLDNANKVLLDSFKGVAIVDDALVHRLVGQRCEPDAQGARVEVSIQVITPKEGDPVQLEIQ